MFSEHQLEPGIDDRGDAPVDEWRIVVRVNDTGTVIGGQLRDVPADRQMEAR